MTARGSRRGLLGAVLIAALSPGTACEPERAAPRGGGAASFVGRQACAECHPGQEALWRGSDHDLAMQPADASTVLGRFDGDTFTQLGRSSTLLSRDGRFFVHTEGPDGEPGEFEVAYTFGARPLQQYLVPFADGRLQVLDVAWDSRAEAEGGQRWLSVYPGERIPAGDAFHWTGRRQTWNAACAACHSTGLRKGYDPETDRYDTTWSEIDVSCEACHGPGSAHVAWARTPHPESSGSRSRGLVVELRHGQSGRWVRAAGQRVAQRTAPAERGEVEACARCHALRSTLGDPHRHGEAFRDGYRLAFLDARYHADGQIRDEVYVYGSFLQSRMYAAGVSCSDCHDPHSLRLRADGNALCATCHDPEAYAGAEHHFHADGSPGAQCVGCHMPETTYMEVDPRRDHSLRVPRPEVGARLGAPDACTRCHASRTHAWAAEVIASHHPRRTPAPAWPEAFHAARSGAPGAADRLLGVIRSDTAPAFVRASALHALRDLPPTPSTLAVLREALESGDADVRRAGASLLELLPPPLRLQVGVRALGDPVRSVRSEAALAMSAVPRERLGASQQRLLDRALTEYEAAQRQNADQPEGALNLGGLYQRTGRPERAEWAYRRALALDPAFPPAAVNLADLYRALGREGDAERVLRDALARASTSPDLHHALGLTLVRARRLDEALEPLERAAQLAPGVARYAWVHGVALHDSGDLAGALRVLGAAAESHPRDPSLLGTLAQYSREAGDLAAAASYERALRGELAD